MPVQGMMFDFETDIEGWDNGVDHLAMSQCNHKRLKITAPTSSNEQKVNGTSSLKYEVDIAAAKPQYEPYCMMPIPTNAIVQTSPIV